MTERIEVREGKAYAVVETWLYSQPVARRAYFELDVDPGFLTPGKPAEWWHEGVYLVPCGPLGAIREIRIAGGPGKPPSFVEESPILPPRGKSQVRWDGCSGRWERLTRKGWTS